MKVAEVLPKVDSAEDPNLGLRSHVAARRQRSYWAAASQAAWAAARRFSSPASARRLGEGFQEPTRGCAELEGRRAQPEILAGVRAARGVRAYERVVPSPLPSSANA